MDLLCEGACASDNGIVIPKCLDLGLYRVGVIRFSGGEKDERNGDYNDVEISGILASFFFRGVGFFKKRVGLDLYED